MTRYHIEPEQAGNSQAWVRGKYETIEAAAKDARHRFPGHRHSESVVITEIGVGPSGLDATPDRYGVFRMGDGSRIF